MRLFKIKNIVALMIIGASLQSCLDLDPMDQLGGGNMWTSKEDYEQFANNFYGWTRDFSSALDGTHSDKTSDLVTYMNSNSVSHGTNTIPTGDGNYTGNYNNIRRTNLLLQNAESYSDKESIKQYIGEAYFFRAYCYFDLLQLYGDAIITKTPLDINSPEMQQKRNDRKEVADFIIDDLNKAFDYLPSFKDLGNYGYARISKEGAKAFLSRVALYEGTWEKFHNNETERSQKLLDEAANAAKYVIDSKQFELFGTDSKTKILGDSAQKYMFILEDVKSNPAGLKKSDNKEYILAREHEEVLSPIGINITKGVLNNVYWVTRKFANMYLCSNGLPIEYNGQTNPLFKGYDTKASEFQNRDNRMKYTMIVPGTHIWYNAQGKYRITWLSDAEDMKNGDKYDPTTGTCYNNQKFATEREVQDTKEGYDYPVIRYAEVLLNYAEAVYERDGKISDSDLNISLNLVRNRANPDMPKLSNELVSANGLDMRTEIRRERTLELFLEGFRLDDLKRWKTAETEMPMDMLGVKRDGTPYQMVSDIKKYSVDKDGCIIVESNREWKEKNYLFPLPSDQLQLNPNLEQNPGW